MSKCAKRRASVLSAANLAALSASRPSTALLTAVDSRSHVHLVVGGNALAGARCTKSLEVGARVIVIAPCTGVSSGGGDEELHYSIKRRVDENKAVWINREFRQEDLTTLGRDEVDNVVDAVFVTLPVHCSQGTF